MRTGLFVVAVIQTILLVAAFDLDFKPTYYKKGDKVDLLVNKVESDHTQLPFPYYNLPFVCPLTPSTKALPMSLGAIIKGDRIWESNYELRFGHDMKCMRLCDLIATESGLSKAAGLIKDGYVVQWLVDGLPGATTFVLLHNNKYYAAGFPMGFVEKGVSYLYNHVMIVIRFHKDKITKQNTIVGFEVYPKSVSDETCPGALKNYKNFPVTVNKKLVSAAKEKGQKYKVRIPWTYSVYWREDNSVDYALRWDMYYENEAIATDHKIHWLSIINSLVLVFFLSLIVAVVLVRVLKKDIQSQQPSLPVTKDETSNNSWKALIDDVSKPPNLGLLLTLLVTSGIQLLVACVGVIVIHFVNTQFNTSHGGKSNTFFNVHLGSIYSVSIFFFIVSGAVSSYFGIILHKMFHNGRLNTEYAFRETVSLSIIFSGSVPSVIFSLVLFLNFFVWAKQSSYALPLGTIVVLISLFLAVEIPLGIIGGYFGNMRKFDQNSVLNSNQAPVQKTPFSLKKNTVTYLRILTSRSWIQNPIISTAIFGLIPFFIVYVELAFVFNSIWFEKTTFYYMYGFLLVTVILLVTIVVETTIVAVYISLAVYNNPNWHWLSFRVGASVGFYIYAYAIFYFVVNLDVKDFFSSLLYFGYMGITCTLISLTFGSVAAITGLIFIKNIYSAIKLD